MRAEVLIPLFKQRCTTRGTVPGPGECPWSFSVGFLLLGLNCAFYYVMELFQPLFLLCPVFQILSPSDSGYVYGDDRGCLLFNAFDFLFAIACHRYLVPIVECSHYQPDYPYEPVKSLAFKN
jgi:hypothetical protein